MKILNLILGLFIATSAFAQGTTIQGSVLDGNFDMEPLAFAEVEVKGLDISAETELDGAFKIRLLDGNYTFIVQYVGYEPFEIENVVVSGQKVVLSPIVLRSRKRSHDLASIAKSN